MIKIYQIRFPDGFAYVGQTRCKYICERIAGHRDQPCNQELYKRLISGTKYELSVLSRHHKQSAADRAEQTAIRRLDKPINRLFATGMMPRANNEGLPTHHKPFQYANPARHKNRNYLRDESRWQRCYVCKRRLPASRFQSDRSRSSGLKSKCRSCSTAITKDCRTAIKNGASTALAYAHAVSQIRSPEKE